MTSTATTRKLDERYGRGPSRARLVWWIVGGVAAAVLFGYLAWTTVSGALASVDADTTGFVVHDARSITVEFQVTTGPDSTVACAVEAQDPEHGIVGWRVVEYPADGSLTRTFRETIPTTAEATTGLVTSCWIP